MFVTVSGNTKLDGAVVAANGTISANAVTANGDYGIITTGALTTAADTWAAAVTFTNDRISATSIIELSVNSITGTVGTNGVPHAIIAAKTAGSATLNIGNIGTNALSGAFTISYRVYNP